MNKLVLAAKKIQKGEEISLGRLAEVLNQLNEKIAKSNSHKAPPSLRHVTGRTIVIGPIRGHACDFAHLLLTNVLPDDEAENIVFLGNYIDGAHQSVEVLYLVALLWLTLGDAKAVVPLIGRHEFLYPIQPEFFGSLQNELQLRCARDRESVEPYENAVRAFFRNLPVLCIVNGQYCCVSGGLASNYRTLREVTEEGRRESLREFTFNELMDEDEERIVEGSAFVSMQNDQPGFRFTFNAVCNFLSRNSLLALVTGMEYHMNRPDYDSFTKPNHYKESMYFPGYILGRINPETKLPSTIIIFSAPEFCGINRNGACYLTIGAGRLDIHETVMYGKRPFITPGPQDHAFSWAQPMMERAVSNIMRQLVFGDMVEGTAEGGEGKEPENPMVAKMRRMCQLLKSYDLPLPQMPQIPK